MIIVLELMIIIAEREIHIKYNNALGRMDLYRPDFNSVGSRLREPQHHESRV